MIPKDQPAPDFSLPDLEGHLHSLREARGKTVILNFWSAECPHAARVDRELLSCLPVWGDRVALITVAANANEPLALLARAAKASGLPMLLYDAKHEVADLYEAATTPHLFVIDPQGVLRYQGAFDNASFRQRIPTHRYLTEAVEAVLSGKAPDPSHTPPYGCAIVRWYVGAGLS